jgi:hypothetical protein
MPATLFEKARTAARLLGEVAAELEGGMLDVEGAKRLVDVFTRCERFAVAGCGVAAGRVATAVNWKRVGHRNPAEWLASTTGVEVGEASRELDIAKRLEDLPATAAAVRSGEISGAQASEIAASASVDPDAEADLLALARDGASFRQVRDQCRETTMRAADDAARARRLHDTRAARTYPASTAISSSTPSSHLMSERPCIRCSTRRPTSCSARLALRAPPSCGPPTSRTRSSG